MRFETTVPPITLEQHIANGNGLKDTYDLLSDIIDAADLQAVAPLTRATKRRSEDEKQRIRTIKLAQKARQLLHLLRNELETELFNQIPRSRDPRDLAVYVYIGDERLVPWEPRDPGDTFDGWRVEGNLRKFKEAATKG